MGVVGHFESNSGSGNGLNAIVIGGTLATVGTTTLYANDLPYLLRGSAYVSASSTLAFEKGVVVKGHDNRQNQKGRLIVRAGGKLVSVGTEPTDLIFTSMHDDTVSANINGTSSVSRVGGWWGITVEEGGEVNLSGFTVSFADIAFNVVDAVVQLAHAVFKNNTTDIQQTASSTVSCVECEMFE